MGFSKEDIEKRLKFMVSWENIKNRSLVKTFFENALSGCPGAETED